MLELLYSGHPDLAWQFFDMAWPPEIKGKDDFLRKFRTRLQRSPFWPLDGELRIPFRNRATYVDEMLRELKDQFANDSKELRGQTVLIDC